MLPGGKKINSVDAGIGSLVAPGRVRRKVADPNRIKNKLHLVKRVTTKVSASKVRVIEASKPAGMGSRLVANNGVNPINQQHSQVILTAMTHNRVKRVMQGVGRTDLSPVGKTNRIHRIGSVGQLRVSDHLRNKVNLNTVMTTKNITLKRQTVLYRNLEAPLRQ